MLFITIIDSYHGNDTPYEFWELVMGAAVAIVNIGVLIFAVYQALQSKNQFNQIQADMDFTRRLELSKMPSFYFRSINFQVNDGDILLRFDVDRGCDLRITTIKIPSYFKMEFDFLDINADYDLYEAESEFMNMRMDRIMVYRINIWNGQSELNAQRLLNYCEQLKRAKFYIEAKVSTTIGDEIKSTCFLNVDLLNPSKSFLVRETAGFIKGDSKV